MALIQCPECKKQISDRATSCPNCGNPMRSYDPQGSTPISLQILMIIVSIFSIGIMWQIVPLKIYNPFLNQNNQQQKQ